MCYSTIGWRNNQCTAEISYLLNYHRTYQQPRLLLTHPSLQYGRKLVAGTLSYVLPPSPSWNNKVPNNKLVVLVSRHINYLPEWSIAAHDLLFTFNLMAGHEVSCSLIIIPIPFFFRHLASDLNICICAWRLSELPGLLPPSLDWSCFKFSDYICWYLSFRCPIIPHPMDKCSIFVTNVAYPLLCFFQFDVLFLADKPSLTALQNILVKQLSLVASAWRDLLTLSSGWRYLYT